MGLKDMSYKVEKWIPVQDSDKIEAYGLHKLSITAVGKAGCCVVS